MNALSVVSDAVRLVWPSAVHPAPRDRDVVGRVRRLAESLVRESDRALELRVGELRGAVQDGAALTGEDVLLPAFALAFEAARRTIGIELYDAQLLGGLALARGSIAEMQTGEGKTFVAMLPAILNTLSGEGVHVMTVNPYLAGRDCELLAPVYRVLGLTVGLAQSEMDLPEKRAAYECDVTYGPGYEFGFDYLRDQVALLSQRKPKLGEQYRDRLRGKAASRPLLRQRGHAAAIVDEADSVMLDEATTPLILAEGGTQPASNADVYLAAKEIADELVEHEHYELDQALGTVRLTGKAHTRIESEAPRMRRKQLDRAWRLYVEQALKARVQFHRDVHYIVGDETILLVDGNTGRIMADRSWQEGLQQAVQAKEGVTITTETKSIARITRQRFLGLYGRRCGMTGTAQGSERELRDVYGLDVVVVPPHRPCQRETRPTRFFADLPAKEAAIAEEIGRLRDTRQPVLVGTADIETSERLARRLDQQKTAYQLLNGKQDAEEAAVVARAGQLGSITIATNMAGRGTDVKLAPGVPELGGLCVIATEPQESKRIDRQLVGRAARQGDPGACQLFASAEDRLFTRHAPSLARRMRGLADASGEIRHDLSREVASLQRSVERQHAKFRRQMFAHDDWLERTLRELAEPG